MAGRSTWQANPLGLRNSVALRRSHGARPPGLRRLYVLLQPPFARSPTILLLQALCVLACAAVPKKRGTPTPACLVAGCRQARAPDLELFYTPIIKAVIHIVSQGPAPPLLLKVLGGCHPTEQRPDPKPCLRPPSASSPNALYMHAHSHRLEAAPCLTPPSASSRTT